MKAEDCIDTIKTLLEEDSTITQNVNSVFVGIRENVPKSAYPCIFIEPISEVESSIVYNRQRITFRVLIACYIIDYDKDRQIIGDDLNKGIMDFKRDIIKAISADSDLSGNCLKFDFINVAYDFSNYPIRGVNIEMDILYQQNFTTRT